MKLIGVVILLLLSGCTIEFKHYYKLKITPLDSQCGNVPRTIINHTTTR